MIILKDKVQIIQINGYHIGEIIKLNDYKEF
jgi:hypothetical protein